MRIWLTALLTAPLVVSLLPMAAVAADDPPPDPVEPVATVLGVTAEPTKAGNSTELGAVLTAGGAPVVGATVVVRRWDGADWGEVGRWTTDETGRAVGAVRVVKVPARNRFRVEFAGLAEPAPGYAPSVAEQAVRLVRRASKVRLRAPARVVDERSVVLKVKWRAGDGSPVSGRVVVQKRVKRAKGWTRWRRARVVTTGRHGNARVKVAPRRTTRWRLVGRRTAWAEGDRSRVRRIRNVPPARPVALPKGAPRPRVTLPKQRRAVGKGANAVVRRIDRGTWRSMVGRSWHRGCPVGRAGLRLVEVNYFGYDGYRRRGQLVVAAGAAGNFAGAFTALYEARVPMRSMYRVDRFGWSRRLGGADDYRSMAAGNTSVFNCRGVVGNPSVRSPHSYGRSLDINPWENPYRASHGWTPNSWWVARSHPRVAWRSRDHRVVRILAAHGFRWTYGTSDAHHFDVVGNSRGLQELLASPHCVQHVCK